MEHARAGYLGEWKRTGVLDLERRSRGDEEEKEKMRRYQPTRSFGTKVSVLLERVRLTSMTSFSPICV